MVLEQMLQRASTAAAQKQGYSLHARWSPPTAAVLYDVNGRLGVLVVLRGGHYLRCPACNRWTQCPCHA